MPVYIEQQRDPAHDTARRLAGAHAPDAPWSRCIVTPEGVLFLESPAWADEDEARAALKGWAVHFFARGTFRLVDAFRNVIAVAELGDKPGRGSVSSTRQLVWGQR